VGVGFYLSETMTQHLGGISMAAPKQGGSVIELPRPNIQTLDVTLIGDAPLIVHKWSEKAKKQIRDKQTGKATAGKEKKDPDQDFKDSLHMTPDGKHGFPVIGIKAAAVTACTSIGAITKVAARQAFHIDGDYAIIQGAKPTMREDMVRVGMGTADIRYRGQYWPWYTTVRIRFNANLLSAEQILNLLNTAGFAVGIGEWRPERDGQHGLFHVATEQELRSLNRKAA
jgi:hypothetical protein